VAVKRIPLWLRLLTHQYVALPLASVFISISCWQLRLIYMSTGAAWLMFADGLLGCVWLAVVVSWLVNIPPERL
jgi:hypothetical protein